MIKRYKDHFLFWFFLIGLLALALDKGLIFGFLTGALLGFFAGPVGVLMFSFVGMIVEQILKF